MADHDPAVVPGCPCDHCRDQGQLEPRIWNGPVRYYYGVNFVAPDYPYQEFEREYQGRLADQQRMIAYQQEQRMDLQGNPVQVRYYGNGQVAQIYHNQAENQQEIFRNQQEIFRQRSEADKTAKSLCLAILTERQRADVEQNNWFDVTSSEGNPYRISCEGSISGNVWWLDGDTPRGTFCAHPDGVPGWDTFLTQKLCLEVDEKHFLRTAYFYGGQTPPWYNERLKY